MTRHLQTSRCVAALALSLLLLASCGPALPQLPISVTAQALSPADVAKLQIILAAPSSEFDPLSHPQQCTSSWIPADQTLPLTGSDGQQHPSLVVDVSGTGAQQIAVTGIPPAQEVLLIVEAIDANGALVGSGFVSPIAQISAGDNPAVSVTVTGFPAVDCDPLY